MLRLALSGPELLATVSSWCTFRASVAVGMFVSVVVSLFAVVVLFRRCHRRRRRRILVFAVRSLGVPWLLLLFPSTVASRLCAPCAH